MHPRPQGEEGEEGEEGAAGGDVELWPEHWAAWQVFLRSQTQCRVVAGLGGIHWQGLIYSEADLVMRRIVQVPEAEQAQVWQQLQVLEDEARRVMNSRK